MSNQYLMPAARCENTGERIKRQDLSGHRYTAKDSGTVWTLSQILAEDLTARTRRTWVAEPFTYTGN